MSKVGIIDGMFDYGMPGPSRRLKWVAWTLIGVAVALTVLSFVAAGGCQAPLVEAKITPELTAEIKGIVQAALATQTVEAGGDVNQSLLSVGDINMPTAATGALGGYVAYNFQRLLALPGRKRKMKKELGVANVRT